MRWRAWRAPGNPIRSSTSKRPSSLSLREYRARDLVVERRPGLEEFAGEDYADWARRVSDRFDYLSFPDLPTRRGARKPGLRPSGRWTGDLLCRSHSTGTLRGHGEPSRLLSPPHRDRDGLGRE